MLFFAVIPYSSRHACDYTESELSYRGAYAASTNAPMPLTSAAMQLKVKT